jgi:hypothetical protein
MAPRKTTRKITARITPPQSYVYRLVVRLQGSEPTVWRLLSVPGHLSLADTSRVILAAMGWSDSHLHQFDIEGRLYGLPDDEWPDDRPVLPDDAYTLGEVLGAEVRTFTYEYDFGDGWVHEVEIQAVELLDEQRNAWPICLAGANACPPEDVGGLGGYEDFLAAIVDPSHEEHGAMWRWNGGPFDPRGFDVNAANRVIRQALAETG